MKPSGLPSYVENAMYIVLSVCNWFRTVQRPICRHRCGGSIYVNGFLFYLCYPEDSPLTGAVCLGAGVSIGGAIAADSGALEDFDESLLPTEKHAPSSDTRELRYMDCSVKSFLIYYNERPALVKIAKRGHGEIASYTVGQDAFHGINHRRALQILRGE